MPRFFSRNVSSLGVSIASCLMLAASATASGCVAYPDSDESFDDDIVVTGYDKNVAFGEFKTFSIDPTIKIVKLSEVGEPEITDMEEQYADPIIQAVRDNMEDRGYDEVPVEDAPELGISLTGINGIVTGTVGGWYGYYGYYWGYPGWGYYYPYTYSYAYRTGSLVTELVELDKLPPPDEIEDGEDNGDDIRAIPVAWASIAYQVLLDGDAVNAAWAKDSVDQAFAQSPYLESE